MAKAFLTPTELAHYTGLERREVISRCLELGVGIYQGRIDRDLFEEKNAEVETRMKKRTKIVRQPTDLPMPVHKLDMPSCGPVREQYALSVSSYIVNMVDWLSEPSQGSNPQPEPFIPLPDEILRMCSDIAYEIHRNTPARGQDMVVEVDDAEA